MSDERDQLGELLHQKITDRLPALPTKRVIGEYVDAAISTAIKAGYRKPQQVTTVEELDALPDGSIILDARGLCREGLRTMGSGNVWRAMGPAQVLRSMEIALPATVLHVGGAA